MSEHELEERIDDLYVELHCFEEKYEKLEADNEHLRELAKRLLVATRRTWFDHELNEEASKELEGKE